MGLGLIPIPSALLDSSSNCSDLDRRLGIKLHPLFASNRRPEGTYIEWNVSEPVDMARHTLNDTTFLASAPATEPPANELRVDFYFFNEPMVRRNWEPITMRKRPTSSSLTESATRGSQPTRDVNALFQSSRVICDSRSPAMVSDVWIVWGRPRFLLGCGSKVRS